MISGMDFDWKCTTTSGDTPLPKLSFILSRCCSVGLDLVCSELVLLLLLFM